MVEISMNLKYTPVLTGTETLQFEIQFHYPCVQYEKIGNPARQLINVDLFVGAEEKIVWGQNVLLV